MTTAIILDDTTREELSASDLRNLQSALDAARTARRLATDGFLFTGLTEIGRAWTGAGSL